MSKLTKSVKTEIDIFTITREDIGQTYIIRPLLNKKDPNKSIKEFKYYLSEDKRWFYKFLCFALVNDELKIILFGKQLYQEFKNKKDILPLQLLNLTNNKAVQVKVKETKVNDISFIDNRIKIIRDDKYRYDNTPEKREWIVNLLDNTNLDLDKALEQEKSKIANNKIDLWNGKTKTLQEIWDSE